MTVGIAAGASTTVLGSVAIPPSTHSVRGRPRAPIGVRIAYADKDHSYVQAFPTVAVKK